MHYKHFQAFLYDLPASLNTVTFAVDNIFSTDSDCDTAAAQYVTKSKNKSTNVI